MKIQMVNINNMKKKYELDVIYKDVVGAIYINDKVVGFCDFIEESNDTLFLEGLEILPEFRGNGYGSKFLFYLFKENPNIEYIKGYSLEEAREFYVKNNAVMTTSCSVCKNINCSRNILSNKRNSLDDVCGDYYDALFIISKERMFANGLYN